MKRLHSLSLIITAVLILSAEAFSLSIEIAALHKPNIAVVPQLYDSKVCIQDYSKGSYRLQLVAASTGSVQGLRNNSAYLWPVAFGGTYAAWIGYASGGGAIGGKPGSGTTSYYVQTIKVSDKTERKVAENVYYVEHVASAANRIAWTDYRFFTASDTTVEVYCYDFSTGSEKRITSQKGYKAEPAIGGGKIVWQDYRNAGSNKTNSDIYCYNLSTGKEIAVCTKSGYQGQPNVNGSIVVWQDFRNAGSDPKNADIYLRDLSTGKEKAICTAPGYQAYPKVYGDIVVWQDYRNATATDSLNADIYLYDLSTDTEMAVTKKSGYQGEPFLYGSTILWFDYTDNTIYKATLSSSGSSSLPAVPKSLSPASDAADVPVTGSLAWLSAQGAKTYRVQLSKASSFSPAIKDTAGIADTMFSFYKLDNSTKYYWRVLAKNDAGSSAWSTTMTFTTICTLPNQVVAVSPSPGDTVKKDSVRCVWKKAAPSVVKYQFQVFQDSLMTILVSSDSKVTDTTCMLRKMTNGKTYWWRVRANNAAGWGAYSKIRRIVVRISNSSILTSPLSPNRFDVSVQRGRIRYGIAQSCMVSLALYDTQGRRARDYGSYHQTPGVYVVSLGGDRLACGSYFLRFAAGEYSRVVPLIFP